MEENKDAAGSSKMKEERSFVIDPTPTHLSCCLSPPVHRPAMGETDEPKSVDAKLDLLLKAVQNAGDELQKMNANLRGRLLVEEYSSSAESTEAAGSSKKKEEKKEEKKKKKKAEEKKPEPFYFPYPVPLSYPYNVPGRSSATTIERFSASLRRLTEYSFSRTPTAIDNSTPMAIGSSTPIAVAIGPYHHDSPELQEMERVKRAALEEFRRTASQQCEAVQAKVLSLVGSARSCYAEDWRIRRDGDGDGEFADMMFLDGWFLLQFMVSMCPDNPYDPPKADPLMFRAEVHTRSNEILRDVLLLENQVPWVVLEALMELWPAVPVDRFLRLMASAFVVGNEDISDNTTDLLLGQPPNHDHDQPPHLLGLFYRRQVGAARTQSLRVSNLSSMSTTAVELAEMGVKLTASKANKFGDMSMSKRRPGLSLSGELSLAPLVLNDLTACWLINMAAYEACLGATQADNFAVSSYISVVALLMNRKEDAQELRAKGIINSAFSDKQTLDFFKGLAPRLHVGHRYYDVFERLQEYKQERWVWIAIHRFLYKNIKTIITVLSIVGVFAGLFKTILSLKQPQP